MDFAYLQRLQSNHVGLRLLRAENLPLIAAFLWKVFVATNQRVHDEENLAPALDDFLFSLNEKKYIRSAKDYLRAWVDAGYLRQYYVEDDDIPRYELSPATDKALDWLHTLRGRSFVGTESRLKTLFQLLRVLVEESSADATRRLNYLRAQIHKLEDEMERINSGDVSLLDGVQVKERFVQIEELARQLLRDFSEVESNFRELDRGAREKISRMDGSRGEVIAAVFDDVDVIRDSEQGRSFAAFLEILMSAERQDELENLLRDAYSLAPVRDLSPDAFLSKIQYGLLEASEKVTATQNNLSSQLRRFLDDKGRLENQRITRLMREVSSEVLDLVKETGVSDFRMQLDETAASIDIMTRNLHRVPLKLERISKLVEADDGVVSATALLMQEYVDERVLAMQVRRCLEEAETVTLDRVVERFPIRKGVAELVAYVKLASRDRNASVDLNNECSIVVLGPSGNRVVKLPLVTFSR